MQLYFMIEMVLLDSSPAMCAESGYATSPKCGPNIGLASATPRGRASLPLTEAPLELSSQQQIPRDVRIKGIRIPKFS